MHEFRPLRNKEQYLASPLSLLIYASLCPTFYSLFLRFGFPCVAPRFCICTMSAGIQLEHYSERDHEILGGRAFNHDPHPEREAQYKTSRDEGLKEVALRRDCMRRAHEAYASGDGATAKQLSNEGKQHAAEADRCFGEASSIVFKTNNAHTERDAIDLHGLYVTEAQDVLERRIHDDQRAGKTHLHVIVGKGNHSVNHIQKIKPAVEELCQKLGLQYATEENEGRIYVNLQGGDIVETPPFPSQHGGHEHHQQQHGGQQQNHPQHHQQQQHHGGQNQEYQQDDEIEKLVTKLFKKYCCAVM
ncbi:DUF1771-domain-containing protein [Nemania serpens]|nr:DUF1771-domain-containing protein [Nemania serpens]